MMSSLERSWSTWSLTALILLALLSFVGCKGTKKTGLSSVNTSSSNATIDSIKEQNSGVVKVDTILWCDTIQRSNYERLVIQFKRIGEGPMQIDTLNILPPDRGIPEFKVANVDSTIKKQPIYKIVFLLPFVSQKFIAMPNREIPVRSIKAIEFYEGAQMALDKLKKMGVNLKVDVLDCKNDTNHIKKMMTETEMKEADVIIGPFRSNELRLVARFAKKHKITLVSPLNPRADIVKQNPNYVQVAPDYNTHATLMANRLVEFEFSKKNILKEGKNIIVLALERDSVMLGALQNAFQLATNKADTSLNTYIHKGNPNLVLIDKFKHLLKEDMQNIVVMPTYRKEGFVYNCLRELSSLVDKTDAELGYEISVVGMSAWRFYERINFEYFENLQLHFTSDFYVNKGNLDSKQFIADYKSRYGMAPREFGFIGYEVTHYFGEMLKEYGVNFAPHLYKQKRSNHFTTFDFQPTYQIVDTDAESPVYYIKSYQNDYLNFLRFENYKLNQTNP